MLESGLVGQVGSCQVFVINSVGFNVDDDNDDQRNGLQKHVLCGGNELKCYLRWIYMTVLSKRLDSSDHLFRFILCSVVEASLVKCSLFLLLCARFDVTATHFRDIRSP